MAVQNPTTNYNWTLPTVGGSADAWGTILNAILGDDATGLDAVVKAISDVADAALPKAGGTVTGAVTFEATPETDAIAEATAGAGVTVDGLLIKDGAIPASGVPELAASKITSGTFDVARIPDLSASKITAGTLASARLAGSYTGITALGTLTALAVSGAATLSSTLAVTGAVTLSNHVLKNAGDASLTISGGTATNSGGNISLFGALHASLADQVQIRAGATPVAVFASGAVDLTGTLDVSGAVTASTFIKSA